MNSINNFLTCKYNGCNKYFMSPVKLPCDKSVCKEHVEKLRTENFSKIKCQFCQSEHDIPSDGFKLNQDIINVLEMNLHLSPSQRKLNDSIHHLNGVVKSMKDVSKDTFIHDYLFNIRKEIKKHRDDLKTQINDVTNDFLKKVDEFENKCKKNKDKMNSNELLNSIKKEAKRLDNELASYIGEIRNPGLDDEKCIKLIESIKSEVSRNNQNAAKVRNELMDNKSISFEKNSFKFDSNLFGSINFEMVNVENESENKHNNSINKQNKAVMLIIFISVIFYLIYCFTYLGR
jgi:hypothetical protein